MLSLRALFVDEVEGVDDGSKDSHAVSKGMLITLDHSAVWRTYSHCLIGLSPVQQIHVSVARMFGGLSKDTGRLVLILRDIVFGLRLNHFQEVLSLGIRSDPDLSIRIIVQQVRYLVEVEYLRDVEVEPIEGFFGAVNEGVEEVEAWLQCQRVIVGGLLGHDVYARYHLRYPLALLSKVTSSLLKLPLTFLDFLHLSKLLNLVNLLLDLLL